MISSAPHRAVDRRAHTLGGLLAFVLLVVATLAFAAPTYPELTGRVVDQAGVIPGATRASLQKKLEDLEDKSGIQLVVATINRLDDGDIETYANGLFRYWKLGEAKKNNGVLFLVAPAARKMRIEVGYGLEGTLTDALSKVILTTAVAPKFKAGDYGAGVERGVDAIIEVLSGDAAEWTKKTPPPLMDELLPFLIFALFIFIFIMMARNAGRPGRYGRYRRGGPPIVILPPSGGGWGDGGWSGGSSWGGDGGGGFDGFSGGGGSSGGGGASGDW